MTTQELAAKCLPYVQAMAEGKRVQCQLITTDPNRPWDSCRSVIHLINYAGDPERTRLRIHPDDEPKQKPGDAWDVAGQPGSVRPKTKRPFTAKDMMGVTDFRPNGWGPETRDSIAWVGIASFATVCAGSMAYDSAKALDGFISRDHGVTWEPMWREE